MNKKERLLQYKQWGNMPRYDLAIKKTSSGYQQGTPFQIGTTSIQEGQDVSGEVAESNKVTIPNAVQQATPYYSLLKKPLTSLFSSAAAYGATKSGIVNSMQNAIAGQVVKNAANQTSQQLLNGGISTLGNGTSQAAAQAAQNATQGLKTNAVAKLGGTLGTTLNAAAAAYGLYNLTSGLAKGPDVPSSSMMDQSHSETTQSINGVDYTTKSLSNTDQYKKILSNNENSRAMSNAISGVGTGASVGSFLGPLGTGIGAAVGGLVGLFGSLFGRNRRKRQLQRRINNLNHTYDNYNTQSESAAASQGMRNDFYDNTYDQSGLYGADKGKTVMQYDLMDKNAPAGYGMVFDKDGYHFGPRNARIGKGESVINYNEGKLAYVDKGKKRADDQYTSAQEGDDNYIAGNDVDITNGISFADQVAPAAKRFQQLEEMKQRIEKSKNGDQKTKQLNLQQIQQMQQQLVESTKEPMKRQDMQHEIQNQYNEYMPQYDDGKFNFDWIQPIIYAGAYSIPNKQYSYYKNSIPYAANSYVRNGNADRALSILSQMRYDPYNQVQSIRNAYRQGLYSVGQSGGLSLGQRMKMATAMNNNYMQNLASIYGQANDANNKYAQTYAQAALSAGEQDAARQQQALAQQQQAYQAAIARRLAGMESANQGKLNILNSLGKNIFQQMQYRGTQDYNNRLLNYYDKQLNTDLNALSTRNQPNITPVNTKPQISKKLMKRYFNSPYQILPNQISPNYDNDMYIYG